MYKSIGSKLPYDYRMTLLAHRAKHFVATSQLTLELLP